jgi:hypothetical protein
MMRARVDGFRYRARAEQLMVGDHSVGREDRGGWAAPLEVVAHASLASLRRALQAEAENDGDNEYVGSLSVSPAPSTEFDEGFSLYEPVTILVHADGRVLLEIAVRTQVSEDDLRQLLAPLLGRSGAAFVAAEPEELWPGWQGNCEITVDFSPRGATVQDAISVGRDVFEFVEHLRDGDLTAESALDLLTAGRGDLLVGLAESRWLEAKRQGYDFSTDHGKIELAQDVARFANGDNSGILVVGLQTRKRRGEEVITKTCPALDAFNTARYHQIIDARLFPPVQGLVVRDVPARVDGGRTGHMLAIYLPTQPDELKPFLVHGAVVRGKVEGAFISIVQRRGEHSIPVTAQGIHATLAAGRALLRRGETGDSKNG